MKNGADPVEIVEIAKQAAESRGLGRTSLLATVLGVSGSSFRHPGARSLVEPEAEQADVAVAVGCLRSEINRRASEVLQSKSSRRFFIDLEEDDPVFGYSLMCPGKVEMLLEPVDDALAEFLERASAAVRGGPASGRGGTPVLSALRLGAPGRAESSGERLLVSFDGEVLADTFAPEASALRDAVIKDAPRHFEHGACSIETYGDGDVFLSPIEPFSTLVIFGADSDAAHLARLAQAFGFNVTVADPRRDYATPERFPGSRIVAGTWKDVPADIFNGELFVAIMNHHYLRDLEALKGALGTRARYIGQIGPEQRTRKLLDEIRKEGGRPSGLDRIFAPMGLDIGSETSREVALSILSEMLAVKRNRPAGCLRNSAELVS